MRKNKPYKPFLLAAGWLFSGLVMASGSSTLAPVVVSLANGGQANIAVSNTDPNLFTVPGDRITAVSGLDGMLTNSEQTGTGGVVVATVSKKPFTFILETERGLNFSVRAVPRAGAGRTVQLVSDLRGTGEEAGAWETATPYESLLVAVSQAVRGGTLPAGWYQIPVTKEALQAPAGLSARADAVWTGNHLKLVRFAVENKMPSALNIRESDFWQPGTRAVMFSQPVSQILAGARMDVYVIRDGEGN
ncbi:type-F conjugative transfer system secretin TraK [Salmonella enterica subsp. enterica serovar Typhimurium]|nr:type-F conjugative transfer system secretin TraK [Salmonella enterica subsp. enterica serovar Typhimurium]